MPRSPLSRRNAARPLAVSLEALEVRALLSVVPGPNYLHPFAHHLPGRYAREVGRMQPQTAAVGLAHPELIRAHVKGSPAGSSTPLASSLQPVQVRHIYRLDAIPNLGAGQTIAIVDAYDDPNIAGDVNVFDKQFANTADATYNAALAAPSSNWLSKAFPSGSTPAANGSWAQEISLDVEWAHAVAPQARIVLVEAASASYADLLGADDYARTTAHATVISNSWGGGESSGELSYDSHFHDATGANSNGVTYVFSAGDSGNQSYPAVSPYVVSVGGTLLSHDSSNNWTGEKGWTSGGGGVSAYEGKPGYQSALSYAKRANPDVAYNGDPNSGVAVYDSYSYRRQSGWMQFGGTSAGAPQWSALIALANQGRAGTGKAALDGFSQTLPAIYAMTSGTNGTEALYDVTTGANSVGSAGSGFDLVTGRGSPRRADLVYSALLNA